MKKVLIVIVILVWNIIFLNAGTPIVKSVEQITSPEQGAFYFPVFSPDGDRIYFTTANYTGLYYSELSGQKIFQLNSLPGAGYEPQFSPDGITVYFRTFAFQKRLKISSLVSQDILTGNQKILIADRRDITTPRLDENANLVFIDRQLVQLVQTGTEIKSLNKPDTRSAQKNVFIENTKIVLIESGNKTTLEPLGDGHYIWPAVSPDGNRLLFTKLGSGTFVSDFDGQNLISLGMANAPKWSPDGQWICYMVEKDDGYVVTESELYVVSADGKQKMQLTDTNSRIEMYPVWGADNTKIAFATDKGDIFLMHLENE